MRNTKPTTEYTALLEKAYRAQGTTFANLIDPLEEGGAIMKEVHNTAPGLRPFNANERYRVLIEGELARRYQQVEYGQVLAAAVLFSTRTVDESWGVAMRVVELAMKIPQAGMMFGMMYRVDTLRKTKTVLR